MRVMLSLVLPALLSVLAGACAPHYQHVVGRNFTSTDALACQGYLVWNHEPVRDVFVVINGSGVLSNAFVHPTFGGLLSSRPVAYSTYDKPGVSAPFGDPAAVRRDDALLQRYTLGHGIACATEAVHWARERFGPSVRLHVRGHSEGSLVALYTLDALLEREPAAAAGIVSVVLSGLAVQPFEEIWEAQVASMPDGARVRAALAACDWAVLKERMGVSCPYVADAVRRPSGSVMFQRLAARASTARFFVFHGSKDWNTPVEPVRALEAWNAAEGHLKMEFHYYEGGHRGTDTARAEVAQLLSSLVSQ